VVDKDTKQPLGIRILALISITQALVIPPVCLVALGMIHSFEVTHHLRAGGFSTREVMFGALVVLMAITQLCIGIGLWKLRNWARILTGCYYMFGLLLGLMGLPALFIASFDFSKLGETLLGPALCGWAVWYLSRPHVKAAFGVQPKAPLDD
jgi:hypothetical protein